MYVLKRFFSGQFYRRPKVYLFYSELLLQQSEFKLKFNSILNDKILDMTNLKALADDKINVTQMTISAFDRVEKIVGKGENAGYQHFLLFQKASFLGKVAIVW